MELVWATDDLVIAGSPYPGFPILLWDSMESCIPANQFFRHYLFRGVIGSKRSWPSTGRALYDFSASSRLMSWTGATLIVARQRALWRPIGTTA